MSKPISLFIGTSCKYPLSTSQVRVGSLTGETFVVTWVVSHYTDAICYFDVATSMKKVKNRLLEIIYCINVHYIKVPLYLLYLLYCSTMCIVYRV